jgi:hypothetical protein
MMQKVATLLPWDTYGPPASKLSAFLRWWVDEVPAPLPGRLCVECRLEEEAVERPLCWYLPPIDALPPVSCPLSFLASTFTAEMLLRLVCAALFERRIIILSDHVTVLTAVAEGITALL